jgi:hypothetical protein
LASPRLFTVQRIANEEVHVFVERYNGRPLILGEGQAMDWFLPSATKDLLMVEAERAIIEAFWELIQEHLARVDEYLAVTPVRANP